MKKFALAQWEGGLKEGRGVISTESGVLKSSAYSFATRFEDAHGTNPEELIAAAHAACFAMAFAKMLGDEGFAPESINAKSAVSLSKQGEGFAITEVHLDVQGRVPGIDRTRFDEIAEQAKEGCPVSKLLDTHITMDSYLE